MWGPPCWYWLLVPLYLHGSLQSQSGALKLKAVILTCLEQCFQKLLMHQEYEAFLVDSLGPLTSWELVYQMAVELEWQSIQVHANAAM